MAITLKQLEALIWVADLGSFKRAADRLNTTQPNISARIAALEGLAGAPLLSRTGTGVTPTPKGEDCIAAARDVLKARDGFEAAIGLDPKGTLRLGVTEMIVHTWLRAFMREWRATFPTIAVELTVDMAATLDQMLGARQIDMAFMNAPFVTPAYGVSLGRSAMVWVAIPGLLPQGPLNRNALAQHPILTHARGTWPHRAVSEHFAGSSARLVPSSNLSVCLQMAIDGMGIAAMPKAMVEAEVAAGALVILDYSWSPDALDFEARFDPERAAPFVAKAADIAQGVSNPHGNTG